METITLSLLRGICQIPAYVAKELGFFAELGMEARIELQPTAWLIPRRLARREVHFAVMPWTRVATARAHGEDLVLICGSGCEEAAIVLRQGISIEGVQSVAVPQEGGIKDLTARALMRSLGWESRRTVRLPSGDAAIISFVGQGADAASMVEPYATMLEHLGIGTVIRRTGDVWSGAPGCSLTTSRQLLREQPELVARAVAAYARAAERVLADPDSSARIAADYIGVAAPIIRRALDHNRPNIEALYNRQAMDDILDLMRDLGYITERPRDFADLRFLDAVLAKTARETRPPSRLDA